jgi:hypothetical protein
VSDDKPKVNVSVHHTLTEEERATIHTGHCAVCRTDDVEVFAGKSGGICTDANACFGRYLKKGIHADDD